MNEGNRFEKVYIISRMNQHQPHPPRSHLYKNIFFQFGRIYATKKIIHTISINSILLILPGGRDHYARTADRTQRHRRSTRRRNKCTKERWGNNPKKMEIKKTISFERILARPRTLTTQLIYLMIFFVVSSPYLLVLTSVCVCAGCCAELLFSVLPAQPVHDSCNYERVKKKSI